MFTYEFVSIMFPEATTFTSIAAGLDTFMVVTSDGRAFSWLSQQAVQVDLPSEFAAVSADFGYYVSCLVGSDGTVRCDGGDLGTPMYGPQSVVLIP